MQRAKLLLSTIVLFSFILMLNSCMGAKKKNTTIVKEKESETVDVSGISDKPVKGIKNKKIDGLGYADKEAHVSESEIKSMPEGLKSDLPYTPKDSDSKVVFEKKFKFEFDEEGDKAFDKAAVVDSIEGKPKIAMKKTAGRTPGQSPKVRAGWADDNKQFNYFLNFLDKYRNVVAHKLDISRKMEITIKDKNGKRIPNAVVQFRSRNGSLFSIRKSYADGRVMFFPYLYKLSEQSKIEAVVEYKGKKAVQKFMPNNVGTYDFKFQEFEVQDMQNVPLDIAFLIDTTGSMGDEIARLKKTIDIINFQITELSSKPAVRFGAVLYRDKQDEYDTKTIPFETDLEKFRAELNKVNASGGGDTAEDLQSGLKDAVAKMDWNSEGIRLLFVISDAPPHLDYNQSYTYIDAMKEASTKGIKICTIGASGLDISGEYVFRQIAQYTMGKYIFLTYGETGESDGGTSTSVSHHTGSNFEVRNLETIIVRIVKTELSYLTDQPIDEGEDYFEAVPGTDNSDVILNELFTKALQQLVDFSMSKIENNTPLAVLPVSVKDESLKAGSEKLEDVMILNVPKFDEFKLLERKDLQKVLEELKLQFSGLFDEEKTVKVGEMTGAQLMVISKLYKRKGKLEMYIKLVRVETGEILSVTLLKIDENLL